MEPVTHQQAALQQLAAVPGVVGGMVFGSSGDLVGSVFPPVFDLSGLQHLAAQLSADGYFQEWLAGENAALELRYGDGHVVVRPIDKSWLLVLCTAQTNPQLLAMSLTQVVRRLRAPARSDAPVPAQPAPPSRPSPQDRLRALISEALGAQAPQALEILAAAGPSPRELIRATSDIEKMIRLFISKKKAEEIGRRMRDCLAS